MKWNLEIIKIMAAQNRTLKVFPATIVPQNRLIEIKVGGLVKYIYK